MTSSSCYTHADIAYGQGQPVVDTVISAPASKHCLARRCRLIDPRCNIYQMSEGTSTISVTIRFDKVDQINVRLKADELTNLI